MASITCVGCGIMGSALINALMNAGHEITVVDLNEATAAPFVNRGAKYSTQLSDALECDFVLLNLPDHSIAKKVIESCPAEKINGLAIVNTTTSSPAQVKEIQKVVTGLGGLYLDSAIECYPAEIGPETGYLVYSGNKAVFDKARDALTALSPEPDYLGENVVASEIVDLGGVGVHYGFVFSLLEGVALCIKNNYDVNEFIKSLDKIFPLMYQAATRQVVNELSNYNGTFEDAKEASLNIETHGLETIIRAMHDSDVKTGFSDNMLRIMKQVIANGYGDKNQISIISSML